MKVLSLRDSGDPEPSTDKVYLVWLTNGKLIQPASELFGFDEHGWTTRTGWSVLPDGCWVSHYAEVPPAPENNDRQILADAVIAELASHIDDMATVGRGCAKCQAIKTLLNAYLTTYPIT